jgi:hypothetical protein
MTAVLEHPADIAPAGLIDLACDSCGLGHIRVPTTRIPCPCGGIGVATYSNGDPVYPRRDCPFCTGHVGVMETYSGMAYDDQVAACTAGAAA